MQINKKKIKKNWIKIKVKNIYIYQFLNFDIGIKYNLIFINIKIFYL